MTTSTRLDTMMAPWICRAWRGAGEGVNSLPGSLGAPGVVAAYTSRMRGCQIWDVLSGSDQLP